MLSMIEYAKVWSMFKMSHFFVACNTALVCTVCTEYTKTCMYVKEEEPSEPQAAILEERPNNMIKLKKKKSMC